MRLSAGDKLGPYEILAPIGAGGMGEVYRARDTRLKREVAIKVSQERFSDRFEREARAVAALNHPNICQIYDVGPNYLVMELVEGTRVAPPDSPRKLLDLAVQMADGIAAAHAANLVHRDLKPDNILVTCEGRVKILDFGLAKATDVASGPEDATRTANLTKSGTTVGTIAYMSPEQARGDVSLRAQSDQFSFGLVLYEMAAGKRAFVRGSTAETMAAIIREDAAPLPTSVTAPLRWTIERLLSKDPAERYDSTRDLYRELKHAREHVSESSVSGEQAAQPAMSQPRWRRAGIASVAALAAACVGAVFFVGQRFLATKTAEPQWNLTQLTRETGLSQSPALSRDGKLVAYSWDGAGDGQFDIYVKQVAGGPPIRLTTDGAGNDSPDFSPDGSRIVFRSDRGGGGIFGAPSFGGQVRLIAGGGRDPKYSPDGAQVAFWVGNPHVADAVPGGGAVFVAPVAGGQPRRIEGLSAARYPIWSPDGRHLLIVGYASAKAYVSSALDWFVVDPGGGEIAKTGMRGAMLLAKLVPDPIRTAGLTVPIIPRPACWSAADSMVTFERLPSLWQAGISPRTSKASGEFRRLTTGAGRETQPSCSASGALTFSTSERRNNVWWAPLDMNRAVPMGELEQVTKNLATHESPAPSRDGRYMAFASDESGHMDIWRRDLSNGKESLVSESSSAQRYPVIDAAGSRIAFSLFGRDKRLIYLSTPGGLPEKLCEGCLRATDWSKDEKSLLIFGGDPYKTSLLDLASHRQTLLVEHPSQHVLYGRFSPDNGWISFTVRTQQDRGRIAIAPLDGPKPVGENAWITIAEEGPEDWANWSPDGKMLFFTSMRDGHYCLWAQRLQVASHKPIGEPIAVQHFHGRLTYANLGWSVGGGRIAITLSEATGNVWMMSRTQAR